MPKCNEDCFNCIYPDCIYDEEEEAKQKEAERLEKARQKCREYYQRHREQIIAKQREKRKADPEKQRKYQREYYARKKREKWAAYWAARKEREAKDISANIANTATERSANNV